MVNLLFGALEGYGLNTYSSIVNLLRHWTARIDEIIQDLSYNERYRFSDKRFIGSIKKRLDDIENFIIKLVNKKKPFLMSPEGAPAYQKILSIMKSIDDTRSAVKEIYLASSVYEEFTYSTTKELLFPLREGIYDLYGKFVSIGDIAR